MQRLSNGTIDPDSEVNRVIELQEMIEKQSSELTAARAKVVELSAKITEIDDSTASSAKELIKSQELSVKLQRDLREVNNSLHYSGI